MVDSRHNRKSNCLCRVSTHRQTPQGLIECDPYWTGCEIHPERPISKTEGK
jgi:hypothetical protein